MFADRLVAFFVLLFAATPGSARADPLPPGLARFLQVGTPPRPPWPRRLARAPLLDPAIELGGVPIVWEREGLTGQGAAVCLVDTGVDPKHRDFLDAEGRTRIEWFAEFGAPPRGTLPDLEARFGVAIWSRDELDDALRRGLPLPGDRHGHGTAMASIAVGDDAELGQEAPGEYAGVAPKAALIVVRALRDGTFGLEDADIAAGVELCFALASRGEAPIGPDRTVALVPLGGHDGAHDGSEPLERALSAIADRGHAIVVAAGNDGGRPIHAGGRAFAGAPARIGVLVPAPREPEPERFVALVIRTAGMVTLRAPDGTQAHARRGEVVRVDHRSGTLVVDARADPHDPVPTVRALIAGGGSLPMLRGGAYELTIEDGAFDVWIAASALGPTLGSPRLSGPHVLEGETITIPATARGVIAVGATVSRPAAADFELTVRDDGSAQYSSVGPAASGAARPDLVAPGGVVFAALSSDLIPDDPTNLLGGSRALLDVRRVGVDRIAVAGSSVAAAIVAGAHALAYQRRGAQPGDRRALLFTAGRRWSPTTGWGALAVDRWIAAREAAPVTGSPAAATLSLTRAVVTPAAPQVVAWARLEDPSGAPIDGGEIVFHCVGRELGRAAIENGFAEAEVRVDAPAGENVLIAALYADRVVASAAVEVRIDEGPRGLARPGGGACAAAPPDRTTCGTALVAVIAFALTLLRRRGRRSA